jgi:hypothetical protein
MKEHAVELESTRRSLHAVAELVMAGPQHRRTGEITLFVCPGGFRTSTGPDLRVDGGDLVAGDLRLPIDGRTAAQLADAVGVDAGAPRDLYHDGSGVKPDEPLDLDLDAARWLEDCWAAGDRAMRALAPDQEPILWPEHFDVGILDAGIGYGVSPGDTFFPEPYAYVTPPTPRSGPFWNAPFGAARLMRELDHAEPGTVLAFFAEGRARITNPEVARGL